MSSTELLDVTAHRGLDTRASRLIVTRRDPVDGRYAAIGYLDQTVSEDRTEYAFSYLVSVSDSTPPMIGFSDRTRAYRSPRLFPSFAERVISARRPDRPAYLSALNLDESADAWEILGASGGYREGDPIELIALPEWAPSTGETSAHFLAHGVRYVSSEASAAIDSLVAGDDIVLMAEPGNDVDPDAIAIRHDGLTLGYVPGPILDYVHSVMAAGEARLTVVRSNSATTHPHLRLLLRLTGRSDQWVFDRPEWATH